MFEAIARRERASGGGRTLRPGRRGRPGSRSGPHERRRRPDEGEREQAQAQAEREQDRAAATREKAEPLYDSAERRERDANKLEQRGVGKEAVSAKMAADVSQAKPATAAVKAQQIQSAKTRPNRSRPPKVQRTEIGR